jgi:hypothetical protein
VALLNQWIDFDPIIDSLWEKFEPKIDTQLDKLREQVVALLPIIGAAAAKAIADKFPDLIRGILDKDPDIPIISDIFDLSELIRGSINGDDRLPVQIPGLGVLGDLFKGFGH